MPVSTESSFHAEETATPQKPADLSDCLAELYSAIANDSDCDEETREQANYLLQSVKAATIHYT